nr:hypothetical protein [uncultured Flavobacterium sp.]
MLFTVQIWDRHKRTDFDELGNIIFIPIQDNNDDEPWKKFKAVIDLEEVKIDYFKEDVIFQNDEMPVQCVQLYLNDGSMLIARQSLETVVKNYEAAKKGIEQPN